MIGKGQTWISTALYIAIGVTTIALVLSVGLPLIEKLKDKNTVTQTKELMRELDNVIRETFEGVGSQREFLIEIRKGVLVIERDKIFWEMKTSAKLIEPDSEIKFGNLIMSGGRVGSEYKVRLTLSYSGVNFDSSIKEIFGRYNLLIKNEGGGKISISEI